MVRIRMGYVLEFCQMILETARYDSLDISCYTPLIEVRLVSLMNIIVSLRYNVAVRIWMVAVN